MTKHGTLAAGAPVGPSHPMNNASEWLSFGAAVLAIAAAMAAGIVLGRRRRAPDLFFEQVRDAALVTGNGTVVHANAAAAELFGYAREELIGLPVAKLLANPEDERAFVRALLAGPVTDYALRLVTSRGEVLDCLITATARFDAAGRIIGCHGLARDVTERNRMVDHLRTAEEDYRGLFENAHDAILILDPDDETVLDANHHACLLYGLPRESFIGTSMLDLSVDADKTREIWNNARSSSRFATFESEHYRGDGDVMNVEIHAGEARYDGRKVILSINRDVTARRKSESLVREREERLRLLLESVTSFAIVMLDAGGRVVSWNEGAERILGYTEDEVVGKPASMFALPEERSRWHKQLAEATASAGSSRETMRVRRDGSRFAASVTLTPVIDDTGALRGYAEITHDVTARAEIEKAREEVVHILRTTAQEWTATFDSVQVPIVMLDEKGDIRRLNRAAQVLAGRPFQQLIRTPIASLNREPWRSIAEVARASFAGGLQTKRASEDGFVWQVSTSLTNTPDGRCAIAFAYDLTILTQLEAAARRNAISAALGTLISGVAHEVRNPLFTISATLDAWEARFGASEGLLRYGATLREQVGRLNRLMRDLLDYGRPNPPVFAETSLAKVIYDATADCAALAEQSQVRIEHELAELPPVSIDAGRMEQVFQNVIDNAIRHSPEGGTVLVELSTETTQIVCRIFDEGPGLGTQDPEAVFQPMYTRRRGGSGLGLAIARGIVTAHGGTITLANRDDAAGAVATIRLPLTVWTSRVRKNDATYADAS